MVRGHRVDTHGCTSMVLQLLQFSWYRFVLLFFVSSHFCPPIRVSTRIEANPHELIARFVA